MSHHRKAKRLLCYGLGCVLWLLSPRHASADTEPLDTTRLDVERLPPEALPLSRAMYHVGFHLRAELGAQGFAFGIGRLLATGLVAHIAFGYELTEWFLVALDFGLGIHGSDAPPPPAATVVQTYTGLLQARFTLPLGLRTALWLSADAGAGAVGGDFLQAYGYGRAGSLGFVYGGALGFDWHFLNPHHSVGIKAGGHLYPQLAAADHERSLALEGTAYLKYVF
jgi:hypothetical protein